MFKNITWGDLLKSKTFWGAFVALISEGVKTLAPANATALLVVQLLSGLLATIGLYDRISPAK